MILKPFTDLDALVAEMHDEADGFAPDNGSPRPESGATRPSTSPSGLAASEGDQPLPLRPDPLQNATAATVTASTPADIDDLLHRAKKIYNQTRKGEKDLLKQRIEIGAILHLLKDKVGHGNFLTKLKEWSHLNRLNFSVATANRSMAYAGLDAAGKLRSVTNLADAERVRASEAKRAKLRKEAEKRAIEGADAADANTDPEQKTVELPSGQVEKMARKFIAAALGEWRRYSPEIQRLLLEEAIELLAETLEALPEPQTEN